MSDVQDYVRDLSESISIKIGNEPIKEIKVFKIGYDLMEALKTKTLRFDDHILTLSQHSSGFPAILDENGYCIIYSNNLERKLFYVRKFMEFDVVPGPKAPLPSVDGFVAEGREFIDDSNNLGKLFDTIVKYHKVYVGGVNYYQAPYISFVQSSGTGKTKTVLELSRKLRLFFISCRSGNLKIQPTRSTFIIDYLIEECKVKNPVLVVRAFLLACAENAPDHPIDADSSQSSIDSDESQMTSRALMVTEDDFKPVITRMKFLLKDNSVTAESLLLAINTISSAQDHPIVIAFDESRTLLNAEYEIYDPVDYEYVTIFRWIRRGLSGCTSIFGIFIDTLPKISNLSPTQKIDPSYRPGKSGHVLFPVFFSTPYMDAIVDKKEKAMHLNTLCLARNAQVDGIENEIRLFYLCQGRPLWNQCASLLNFSLIALIDFAMEKLLCAKNQEDESLKSLTVTKKELAEGRILEISEDIAVINEKFSLSVVPISQFSETMVSRHMCICFGISEARDCLFTMHPSEPVIIEAINSIRLYSNSLEYFLKMSYMLTNLFSNYCQGIISRGDSGELVARILLITAFDVCNLLQTKPRKLTTLPILIRDFLKVLMGEAALNELTLPVEYLEGYVGCSHFIRLLNYSSTCMLDEALAKKLFRRGAGCMTWRGCPGSDLEIPVAYCKSFGELKEWKTLLSKRNSLSQTPEERQEIDAKLEKMTAYTFISISVKNVKYFPWGHIRRAFDSLDPLGMIKGKAKKEKTENDEGKESEGSMEGKKGKNPRGAKKRKTIVEPEPELESEPEFKPSSRNKSFGIKGGLHLHLLFNLQSSESGISVFKDDELPIAYGDSTVIKRVLINGVTAETFPTFTRFLHHEKYFEILKRLDYDVESKLFAEQHSIAGMIPVSFVGDAPCKKSLGLEEEPQISQSTV